LLPATTLRCDFEKPLRGSVKNWLTGMDDGNIGIGKCHRTQ